MLLTLVTIGGLALVYIRWNDDYLLRPYMTTLGLLSGQEVTLAVTDGPMEWSPHGSRIAPRIEERSASSSGIYMVAPNRTNRTQLTVESKTRDEGPV